MQRSIVRWGVVTLLAVAVAACSDAPSDATVARSVAIVSSAPLPAGASDDVAPAGAVGVAVRGTGTVWRSELCSDKSCPLFLRWFSRIEHATLGDACAALSSYVAEVGGAQPSACPPKTAARSASSDDTSTHIVDEAVVVIPGGKFGNSVHYTLEYDASKDGTPLIDRPAALRLRIGQQVCSSSSIAPACAATPPTP